MVAASHLTVSIHFEDVPVLFIHDQAGLVVDKEHGNIFKMDAHRQVGRCYHGYTQLSQADRIELYGSRPISLGTDRYHWVDTLFSLPEATLLAGIIDDSCQQGGFWQTE